MLALSIPRFRYALLTDELKSTTRHIVGLVKGLRNEAITEQEAYFFHLDLESRRLWVESENMDEQEREMARERAFTLPDGVTIADVWRRGRGKKAHGKTAIRFSSKGYVEQTAIHLEAEDGREFTLVLEPFLSKVKSYDTYVDIYR